jgi:hypothetical protein
MGKSWFEVIFIHEFLIYIKYEFLSSLEFSSSSSLSLFC